MKITRRDALKASGLSGLAAVLSPAAAQNLPPTPQAVNGPVPNPYLANPFGAIGHFDPAATDSTPYGPPPGVFTVDPTKQPIVYGGPISLFNLASTDENYMWHVGSDRVSYVYQAAGRWISVATFQALADASNNSFPAIPNANFRTFGTSSAVGTNVTSMEANLSALFGANYADRFGNGVYSLVDKDNVLYVGYLDTLYGFTLANPARPSDGITVRYKFENVVTTLEGNQEPSLTRIVGLSLTYDGHIIIILTNGIAVISRSLDPSSVVVYRFPDTEYVSNSICVDENNGIYVASGSLAAIIGSGPSNVSVMRKLVWTGAAISDKASDGAWSSPYDNSGNQIPPIIKLGNGTGSTPTLMGFGDDPDKLVVITDGAQQMKLVAFWRNEVPNGSQRIAGQIQVTCGFNPLPTWIQSEQSVVVYGYGAFVVNNIPATVDPQLAGADKIAQVSLMGAAYPASFGVQRFQWNPSTHSWSSAWARSDVSSTSMVPVHSVSSSIAAIGGYVLPEGWQVLGLDWDTGQTVHQTIFGNANFGNGAYAIVQYLPNQDLLFNSICGPLRVHYGP